MFGVAMRAVMLQLSLADAIAMGLENNLAVEVTRFTPYIAYEDTRIAWGAYDPEMFAEGGYTKNEIPNANLILPRAAIRSSSGPGLRAPATTWAPAETRSTAICRPMPRLAPVTSAT